MNNFEYCFELNHSTEQANSKFTRASAYIPKS